MFSIDNIKLKSKESLEGKYSKYFLMMIFIFLISLVTEFFRPAQTSILFETVSLFITYALSMYVYKADLTIALGFDEFKFSISDISYVAIKGAVMSFLMLAIIGLGLIFFIIPGLILSYMFSQAYYILIEDESKSMIQCLIESKNMMKGNIWNYILLQLSYFPSIIIGFLTLGIGFYWIIPRISVSNANFYLYVEEQYNRK